MGRMTRMTRMTTNKVVAMKRDNYSVETIAVEQAFLRMRHATISGDRSSQMVWAERYTRALQARRLRAAQQPH